VGRQPKHLFSENTAGPAAKEKNAFWFSGDGVRWCAGGATCEFGEEELPASPPRVVNPFFTILPDSSRSLFEKETRRAKRYPG